jgi:hypothetical protein
MEHMIEVFAVERCASGAPAVKGTFAAGVAMIERGEKTELELVGCLTLATKATPRGFLNMDPGNIIEDMGRPVPGVPEIFTCPAFHHALTEKVATATRETAATYNKKTCGGGKGE